MDLPYSLLVISPFFPPLAKLQHKEQISMQQGRAWAEDSNRVDPTSTHAAGKELRSMSLLGEGTRRGGGAH
jgi:UDP-N-acetylmuramoylalanine-D-glutamate ligase